MNIGSAVNGQRRQQQQQQSSQSLLRHQSVISYLRLIWAINIHSSLVNHRGCTVAFGPTINLRRSYRAPH
jgi:hypothetical protein